MRVIVAAVLCCMTFGAASAQQAFVPDLADIMAGTQLRHAKLSYAGNVQNWPLAAYEVGQMTNRISAHDRPLRLWSCHNLCVSTCQQ